MGNIEKKTQKLSKRQIRVLDGMFEGDLTLNDILKNCRVSQITYYDWLDDSLFMDAFDKRIDSARAVLTSTLAAYSQAALFNLVNLTRSEKTETARKACLDIVKLIQDEKDVQDAKVEIPNVPRPAIGNEVLSQEQSSLILRALAEGGN